MTMADVQVESAADNNALLQHDSYKLLKNKFLLVKHHNISHHNGPKQRKRKRLDQVVDKLTNNNVHNFNNNNNNENGGKCLNHGKNDENHYNSEEDSKCLKYLSKSDGSCSVSSDGGVSATSDNSDSPAFIPEELSSPSLINKIPILAFKHEPPCYKNFLSVNDDVENLLSSSSSSTKSPHSSNVASPKVSPCPTITQVELNQITDIQKQNNVQVPPKRQNRQRQKKTKTTKSTKPSQKQKITPPITTQMTSNELVTLNALNFQHYFHQKYLPNLHHQPIPQEFDRNWTYDATHCEHKMVPNKSHTSQAEIPEKIVGQIHRSSKKQFKQRYDPLKRNLPQDCPLDLSKKGSTPLTRSVIPIEESNHDDIPLDFSSPLSVTITPPQQLFPSNGFKNVPIVKGDVASSTTKESVAVRYNLDVSPVVEEMPPGSDVAYVCPTCGQMFSLQDRLAKHMASRHKSRAQSNESGSKAYLCNVCNRSFARSDMLTRHMRLHTGVKPYTCKICSQVFSRSDHLSTHKRTHTGEKPYKCPQCQYAACRRDMITRHMRTHTKQDSNGLAVPINTQAIIEKCDNGSIPAVSKELIDSITTLSPLSAESFIKPKQ